MHIASRNTEGFRADVPQRNIAKFKEVFLYILEKVGAKPNIGQTALYKLLYFIDFDFYELYEQQLVGMRYIKNKFGPSPSDFAVIAEDMIKQGEIEEFSSKYFGKDQKKYLPIRKADLSGLTALEIKHIDAVLDRLSNKTGAELSELSHRDVPWLTTETMEEIPYESVFYRTSETSVRTYNEL